MSDTSYSFSLTTFSPSGKLLQIEHALKAVQNGDISLGIQATNGVVLATPRKAPSPLVEVSSLIKVAKITENIGMVYSGMGADFRVLAKKARQKGQKYVLKYHEEIPVRILVREIATIMQEYTQAGGVRPFGVSVMIAGMDEEGPQLFQADPSGSYFQWKASAIGQKAVNAKAFLERRYSDDMEIGDAIHTALLTLKDSFEGEMTSKNIAVTTVTKDGGFKELEPSEIQDYLEETL